MSSDALYNSCVDETIKLYWQTQSPVFAYVFDYKGENSMVNLLVNEQPTVFSTGVCHGDELFLLFNLRILGLRDSSHMDDRVSNRLTSLWTDFAKIGYAPRIDNYEFPRWQRWDPESMVYYRIGGELSLGNYFRQPETYFWSHHMRNISGVAANGTFVGVGPGSLGLAGGSGGPGGRGPPLSGSLVSGRPLYRTLAWSMVIVSVSLFVLILILLGILFLQRRRQSFRAQTPASSSHVSTSAGSTLY